MLVCIDRGNLAARAPTCKELLQTGRRLREGEEVWKGLALRPASAWKGDSEGVMMNHVAGGWTGTMVASSASQRVGGHQKNLWGPAGLGSQRKKLCKVCRELPAAGCFGG